MTLLAARGIHAAYGAIPALSGVDLKVEPGEFVGLIGPNGAGKSTLLATLTGALQPKHGEILLMDRPLASWKPRERARIVAHLPQQADEDGTFRVADLVDFGRTPHRGHWNFTPSENDRAIVASALERSGAAEWADRPLGSLSGGQRQRVRIAMALAQEPLLLLADEPTTAVDLAGQVALMSLLQALAHQGLGVVAVLHDLNMAAQFCDRLVLLTGGHVMAEGPPTKVITEDSISLAYGAAVQVAYHPQTGAPFLMPRVALNRTIRTRRVHLVAGGGSGKRLIPRLWSMGYDLTVGVLNALDADQELAATCGVPTLTEAPFAPISEQSGRMLQDRIAAADAVVIAACAFGPGNLLNLETAMRARGRVWLISPPDISERDHTGGRATAIYASLVRRGAEILDEEALLSRFKGATTRGLDGGTFPVQKA